jgi:hypothetical protein
MAKTETLPKLSYSIEEFATMTSLSKAQVYLEISEGRLQVKKAGRRSLVALDEAQRWLADLPVREATGPSGSK